MPKRTDCIPGSNSDRFATTGRGAGAVEVADPLIGACGNPLFIAAAAADIEAARASIGWCEPHLCRICQGLHTPVEDLWFFHERVFLTYTVSIASVTRLVEYCAIRDCWVRLFICRSHCTRLEASLGPAGPGDGRLMKEHSQCRALS